MNNYNNPPKDFDLPKSHLTEESDYIPPRARNRTEALRRQSLPSNKHCVILEHQADGASIAARILETIDPRSKLSFVNQLLGATAFNSSWYTYVRDSEVMRRRLKLPVLDQTLPRAWSPRPSTTELSKAAGHDLQRASAFASSLVQSIEYRAKPSKIEQTTILTGRAIGTPALKLACGELGSALYRPDVQEQARQESLCLLSLARDFRTDIGTNPSLAQLANPDSDVAVFWRRNAPDEALEAYHIATEGLQAA